MFPGRIRPIAIFKEKSKRISKHEKRKQDRSQIQIGQAPVCSIGGGERKAAFGTGKQQGNIPERKAEVRHESMYSLETLSEREGNELSAGMANAEEEIIERETIAERNKRLYAAIRTLSPRQQEVIHKVYFEEKSQRAVSKDLGVSEAAISIQLTRAMRKLKKLLEK